MPLLKETSISTQVCFHHLCATFLPCRTLSKLRMNANEYESRHEKACLQGFLTMSDKNSAV